MHLAARRAGKVLTDGQACDAYRCMSSAAVGTQRLFSSGPDHAVARVDATGERATTVCVQGGHTITIDAPVDQDGHDNAPGPVAHFLGSLIGSSQAALHSVAEQSGLPIGKVSWTAEAVLDARGVHGEVGQRAVFDSVQLRAQVETDMSHEKLTELQKIAMQRCIVANTLQSAGVRMNVRLHKALRFQSSMGTHIP